MAENNIELRRVADRQGQPCYEVVRDGVVLGTVYRRSVTVERRFKGQRYVHSRRESKPRHWDCHVPGKGTYITRDTRKAAVEDVVRLHDREDD